MPSRVTSALLFALAFAAAAHAFSVEGRGFNANGVVSHSPGLATQEPTLGNDEKKHPTPTGLRPLSRFAGQNPVGVFLATLNTYAGAAAAQENFTPARHDPFVGDWLPKNAGDYVAQVFATGGNAYQANLLAAFDDKSAGTPVAILRGTRPDEKSPVTLRETRGGDWTGTIRPDCCGSPQMELSNPKTGEKIHLSQYMRPNPALRMKPPEGATVLFGDKMHDGVMTLAAGQGRLASREEFGGAGVQARVRAHLEFRLLGGTSAGAVSLWRGSAWVGLLPSYGRDGGDIAPSGSIGPIAPDARAERAVLEWQALDIETSNGKVTVFLNSIKIHDNLPLAPTPAGRAPLEIETRGAPLEFRNIWAQENH